MQLEIALGSLMLDVEGLELAAADIRRLQDASVGGVILFARNFQSREQVSDLNKEIRQLREPELLIAVDQEGGRVQRFQAGFTQLPPMSAFGRLLDAPDADKTAVLALARNTAQLMAEEVIACGVDFSFAPVLDLAMHEDTVIGDRAFHADPEKLIAIALAFIQGMNAAGMQATGKHFPGHGHVLVDSHLETPVDQRQLSDIEALDMRPFIALKNQLSAVMTAHIDYSDIDKALPTFSSFWLQKILRQQIGFNGLIFSDDLSMHGACIGGNIVERAELALKAGCDMLLVCNDPAAMDALLQARQFLANELSQQRFSNMKARPQPIMLARQAEQLKEQLSDLS